MHDAPAPGEVLAGKFRVERVLGRGGMGVVLSTRHVELDEPFAVKLLHAARSGDPSTRERFRREARAAARLRGEHVARVSDFGTLDDGTPYLVMEHLRGPTLAEVLRGGPVSPERAAAIALDVAAGLAEAHALGIVHRDVKPANLLLTERPDRSTCVKVLDFGIAKVGGPGAAVTTLTATTATLGSPAYMAPEQVRDARGVGPAADVWALGVVLYEAVSGKHPFDGFTVSGLLAAILDDEPVPLARVAPSVPPAFASVVHACLAKDPAARPDLGELAARLGPFAGRDGRSVARILDHGSMDATVVAAPSFDAFVDDEPTEAPSVLTRDPALTTGGTRRDAETLTAPRRSNGLLLGAAAVGLAGLSFGAAALVLRGPQASTSSTAAPVPVVAPSATGAASAPPSASIAPRSVAAVTAAPAASTDAPRPAGKQKAQAAASAAPPAPPAAPPPAGTEKDKLTIPGFGSRL